jgi:hypothetical protein
VRKWSRDRSDFLLAITTDSPKCRKTDVNFGNLDAPWILQLYARFHKEALQCSVIRIEFCPDDPPEMVERATRLFPEGEISRSK